MRRGHVYVRRAVVGGVIEICGAELALLFVARWHRQPRPHHPGQLQLPGITL